MLKQCEMSVLSKGNNNSGALIIAGTQPDSSKLQANKRKYTWYIVGVINFQGKYLPNVTVRIVTQGKGWGKTSLSLQGGCDWQCWGAFSSLSQHSREEPAEAAEGGSEEAQFWEGKATWLPAA